MGSAGIDFVLSNLRYVNLLKYPPRYIAPHITSYFLRKSNVSFGETREINIANHTSQDLLDLIMHPRIIFILKVIR